jgi:tetratricopeptide (TPR) repeat protein
VHNLLGEPERERALLTKVKDILEQVGDVGYLLILYNNLGHTDHQAGLYEDAMVHHGRLVDLARRVDHRPWQAAGLVGLADALLASGRVAEAGERAQAAHDLVADAGGAAAVELAMSCRALGDVALALGDPARARQWFEAGIPTLEAMHEHDELAKARLGVERAEAATAGGAPAEREQADDPS